MSRTLRPEYVAEQKARLTAELEVAYRECPFCKEDMRRDASVCPHCRNNSEPWVFKDWKNTGTREARRPSAGARRAERGLGN